MPDTATDFEDRMMELVHDVPVDGISENMIYYSLRPEDWEITREDIERAASALVDDGIFEVTGEIQVYRRLTLDKEQG